MAVTEVEAARALLPSWVPWIGPALYLLGVLAIAALLQRVLRAGNVSEASLRRDFEGQPEHWTRRARRVWGRRVLAQQLTWILALVSIFMGGFLIGPFSLWQVNYFAACVVVLLYGSMIVWGYGIERVVYGEKIAFASYLRGRLVGLLLLYHVVVWAVATAILMPNTWSTASVIGASIALGLLVFLSLGGNFWLVRALGLAQRADEELQAACDRAAEDVGAEPVGVWVVDGVDVNAFAVLSVPVVLFTRPATSLPFEERRAVARHEYGHLLEGRRQHMLRRLPLLIVVLIAFFGPLSTSLGFFGWLQLVLLVVVLVFFFGARLVKLEESADEHARQGERDEVYARALERIHKYNLFPAILAGQNKSHPDLYFRMQKAGVEPDFSKPEPPVLYRRTHFLACLYFIIALGMLESVRAAFVDAEEDPVLALALGPEAEEPLEELAERAIREGRSAEARSFYGACDVVSGEYRIDLAAELALLAHAAGDAEAAREHLAAARERRDRKIEVQPEIDALLRRARSAIEK